MSEYTGLSGSSGGFVEQQPSELNELIAANIRLLLAHEQIAVASDLLNIRRHITWGMLPHEVGVFAKQVENIARLVQPIEGMPNVEDIGSLCIVATQERSVAGAKSRVAVSKIPFLCDQCPIAACEFRQTL